MKEAYAVRRTVPPSAEVEEQIEHLLAVGVSENPRESLSELARLGARLIIQRAVEDEFGAWLGRARYERRSGSARGPGGESSALRNGFRSRTVHTLEGELEVDIPQARAAAQPFVSKLFCVQHQGVAHRAAAGDGDRRVRARPVDARHRGIVRRGGARESVQGDRVADLPRAQRAL